MGGPVLGWGTMQELQGSTRISPVDGAQTILSICLYLEGGFFSCRAPLEGLLQFPSLSTMYSLSRKEERPVNIERHQVILKH